MSDVDRTGEIMRSISILSRLWRPVVSMDSDAQVNLDRATALLHAIEVLAHMDLEETARAYYQELDELAAAEDAEERARGEDHS
jgi:hypothetical protein